MKSGSQSSGARGFHAGAEKAFALNSQQAWKLFTSPEGLRIWLGAVPRTDLKKGPGYHTKDGTVGRFLAVDEGNSIRLSWHPRGWEASSTLFISLISAGDDTVLRVRHEGLTGAREAERLRSHWEYILEQLQELAVRAFNAGPNPATG